MKRAYTRKNAGPRVVIIPDVVFISDTQGSTEPLPQEFTLQLGPRSEAQISSLARILQDLGAEVEVCSEGGLVAVRPAA